MNWDCDSKPNLLCIMNIYPKIETRDFTKILGYPSTPYTALHWTGTGTQTYLSHTESTDKIDQSCSHSSSKHCVSREIIPQQNWLILFNRSSCVSLKGRVLGTNSKFNSINFCGHPVSIVGTIPSYITKFRSRFFF